MNYGLYQYLFRYELSLVAIGCVFLDVIGEEEHLQDNKDDEQLDQYDNPQSASQRHVAEAIVV